ncbi:MAG: tyrosine--tRNA ligase [Verrucomicrobia bacterium]|nr:tyrosine--tRNA ligase [Verrucomicrobiota bacterium]
MNGSIIEELRWRGLVTDCTDPTELEKRLSTPPVTLYAGFDPTADSLHVGSLVPLIALRRFQIAGHKPIALAGGATGSIGDPSGKTQERQLLSREILDHNIRKMKEQLARLLDFTPGPGAALVLDNADWTANVTLLDFLRDIGKHFSVNMMTAKESVRARMEDRETGISFTEFSYMLLQAFDFYHLRKEFSCELQIGGSDQWGNITAGTDLCRKKLSAQCFGLTLPLITNSDGTKFGKTVAGAIWLDSAKTSVYRFYQFWMRTDDRDVIRYLKFFTFLSREEVESLEKSHLEKPEGRVAHKALADAVTKLVHGSDALAEAIRASEILFGGGLEGISEQTFADIAGEIPSCEIPKSSFGGEGMALLDLLVTSGLSASKGQARKDVEGGGIYINNQRVSGIQQKITTQELLFGNRILLRKGKRNYACVTAKD